MRALSRGISWEFEKGETRTFVFSVAEDLQPYNAQLQRFRTRLFGWFGVLMLLLLGALAFSCAACWRRCVASSVRSKRSDG